MFDKYLFLEIHDTYVSNELYSKLKVALERVLMLRHRLLSMHDHIEEVLSFGDYDSTDFNQLKNNLTGTLSQSSYEKLNKDPYVIFLVNENSRLRDSCLPHYEKIISIQNKIMSIIPSFELTDREQHLKELCKDLYFGNLYQDDVYIEWLS